MILGRKFEAKYSKLKCLAVVLPQLFATIRFNVYLFDESNPLSTFAFVTICAFSLRLLYFGFIKTALFEVNECGVFKNDDEFLQWKDISHIELAYRNVHRYRRPVLSFRVREDRLDKTTHFSILDDSYDTMSFYEFGLMNSSPQNMVRTIEMLFSDIIKENNITVSIFGIVSGDRYAAYTSFRR